ncbi:uncharacterized protein LOC135383065 [Ornithodoros turicata]|uniref:uncharacterized protein LOC135383065 n=1 Tax=Ornithodoros turicata TaxID=34597 RepID=UPI00313A1FBD
MGGDVRRAIVDILFQECMTLALGGKLSFHFVGHCCCCCFRYPSHRLYRRSAELLAEFPHLRDNFSVNGKMGGHYSWVEALKCKFKNMRKKLDDNPAVLAMRDKHAKKRVKPPEEACPNATKRVSRLHGHEHLIVLGETEQSLENHRQGLICHSEEEESQVTKERFLLTAKERHEKMMTVTLAADHVCQCSFAIAASGIQPSVEGGPCNSIRERVPEPDKHNLAAWRGK